MRVFPSASTNQGCSTSSSRARFLWRGATGASAPLVDYLAASLPPKVVRGALGRFDEGVLERIVPRILPRAVIDDPLLVQRLRLPARRRGGALRERGGWLADASHAATMLRVLPMMVDHTKEGSRAAPGSDDKEEVGFLPRRSLLGAAVSRAAARMVGHGDAPRRRRRAAACRHRAQRGMRLTSRTPGEVPPPGAAWDAAHVPHPRRSRGAPRHV